MKAAIYHRVSTTDQDPTLARGELVSAATARGYEIALDVEEVGTGARNDRPGLVRIMDAARRGRIDAVFVWKLDRFGRSALDLLANAEELGRCGVRFVATTQGIDLRPGGDPMSQLILAVLAGVAQFERSIIIERTKLGLAKARANGKRLGRPRMGSAPTSHQVVELRAAGLSWAAVASQLGCTPSAARRACQNGAPIGPAQAHEVACPA